MAATERKVCIALAGKARHWNSVPGTHFNDNGNW